MGGPPTPLAQRQSPPSGGANGGAGRRISPELAWPGSSSPSLAAALRPGLDRVRVETPEE